MRLVDDERDMPITGVTAYLTADELRDLHESLAHLFQEEGVSEDPEWHTHVLSEDGRPYELTLGILVADRPGLEQKWVRFFNDDVWEVGLDR